MLRAFFILVGGERGGGVARREFDALAFGLAHVAQLAEGLRKGIRQIMRKRREES